MNVNDELPSLLATLYAAPLEPQKWQTFFERLCVLTQTSTGYLLTSDAERGNALVTGGGISYDPEVLTRYNQHYGAQDPYQPAFEANPRVGVINGEELVPHSRLVKLALWNDLLASYDLEYMTMVVCKWEGDAVELFGLWRSARHPELNAASTQLLSSLAPHVRTALELRSRLELTSASAMLSETAFDMMGSAAFLVDHTGCIHHRNRLAERCLQAGGRLQSQQGRLIASNSNENVELQMLIRRATARAGRAAWLGTARIFPAAHGGAMHITRPDSASVLQVAVLPLPEQSSMVNARSFAMVFVLDAEAPAQGRGPLMHRLFSLTPTEGRLADLLLQGLEVREAAERLRITLATARFHLKRIFVKTRTHRQSELMRLMLSLPGVEEEVGPTPPQRARQ